MGSFSRRQFIASASGVSVAAVAGCTGGGNDGGGGSDGSDGSGSDGGGGDGGSTGTPSDSGGSITSLRPTVSNFPITPHGVPYIVAMEHGWYEEEGISLEEFVSASGGGTTVRALVTGGLPFGDMASTAIPDAYLSGAPISIISGGVNQLTDMAWASMADSDVTEIQDLAGGSLAYTSPQSTTHISGQLSIRNADGISVDEVELVSAGGVGEGITLLNEGEVDVAVVPEPGFTASSDNYNLVFRGTDYVPDFVMSFVAMDPQYAEENPEIPRTLNRVRNRAVSYIRENPEEAGRMWASYNEGRYDPDIAAQVVAEVFPEDEWSDGTINLEGLRAVDDALHYFEIVEQEVPWADIINQSYLPEENRVDLSDL